MCPQRDIVCPADSVVLFIPTSPSFEPIDLNASSNLDDNDNLGREPQISSSNSSSANHTISRRSADAAAVSKDDKGKRSVPETDDELTDGHHVLAIGSLANESSAAAVPYEESSGEELMKICCTQSMCICKPELCPSPKCEPGLVPIVMNRDVGQPGHCCPIFKCDAVPDCQNLDNGHNWRENCRSCLCFEREAKCQETSCLAKQHEEHALEDLSKARHGGIDCYSIALSRPFVNGSTWQEGDCDHCECKEGEVKCRTNFCINLVCEDQVKVAGECCPKCKDFCEKHEYCDKKCSFGHNVDPISGCRLCECASLPPLVPKLNANQTTGTATNADAPPPPVTGPSITGTTETTTASTPTTTETKPSVQINIINNNYHNSSTTTAVAEQEENWNGHIYVGTIAFLVGLAFGALGCFGCMRHRQRKQQSYSTVPHYDLNANPIAYKGA